VRPADGVAEPVQHAPEEFLPDLHTQASSRCRDLAAGTNALHLADRHEQDAPLPESDDLCGHCRHPGEMGSDIAQLADGHRGSLRLDDETDDLRDLPRELHR